MNAPLIAVVGATGLVGREVVAVLAGKDHPGESLLALGTSRTEGEEVDFDEETLPVETTSADSFRGVKAAVLAVPAPEVRALADRAQKAGAWVVDVSGVFVDDSGVPLIAPALNEARLAQPITGRVVALAHPVTQALAAALGPLARLEPTRLDVTVLVGASAFGHVGVRLLEQQTASLLSGRDPEAGPFPHRLAFNLVPQVGAMVRGRSALEERVRGELPRVWPTRALALTVTALAAPIFHGALLTLNVHLSAPATADAVRAALVASPALKVLDEPDTGIYPMAMLTTGDPAVHVGRLRVDGAWLQLVVALDPVGRAAETAATLALQLAARA